MLIAGIDYSLNGPSICVFNGEIFNYDDCTFYFLTDIKKYTEKPYGNIFGERFVDWNQEMERYESIADWALETVMGCDAVALEGYAYSAQGRVFHIAENTGVLKYKMYQIGLPVTVFTPSEIKKYATGKGNADKQTMYDSFVKETKERIKDMICPDKKDVGNPVSDIVDSYYICKFLFEKIRKEQNLTA
jgi:hypothetical protein